MNNSSTSTDRTPHPHPQTPSGEAPQPPSGSHPADSPTPEADRSSDNRPEAAPPSPAAEGEPAAGSTEPTPDAEQQPSAADDTAGRQQAPAAESGASAREEAAPAAAEPAHPEPARSEPGPGPAPGQESAPESLQQPAPPITHVPDAEPITPPMASGSHEPAEPSDEPPPPPQAPPGARPAEKSPGALASAPPVRTGTVAAIRGKDVVVEFTGRRAGICPISAFAKTPRIGQRIGFIVGRDAEDDAHGPVKILRPAVGAAAPQRTPIKELNVGDVFDATVVGMNTGGLEVKVAGHRAFLPASQVDRHRVENFVPYLNKTLRCRIVELNRRKRRIVVSRRSVLDDEARAELGEKMVHIKPGEVRECAVRKVEKFGVFLEWEPGIDGLVRVADLAHGHVEDPKALFKRGDEVQAKVLRVEPAKARLALGIRQAQPSPWRTVEERYPVGSEQKGKVTRTADFGAFVELEPGIEGLIHISQLSTQRVENVEQVVQEGQEVTARVVQCDGRRKRVGLSIRALTEPEAMPTGKASRDDMRKYVKSEKKAHAGESLGSLMDKFGGSGGLKGGLG